MRIKEERKNKNKRWILAFAGMTICGLGEKKEQQKIKEEEKGKKDRKKRGKIRRRILGISNVLILK